MRDKLYSIADSLEDARDCTATTEYCKTVVTTFEANCSSDGWYFPEIDGTNLEQNTN